MNRDIIAVLMLIAAFASLWGFRRQFATYEEQSREMKYTLIIIGIQAMGIG